MTVQYEAFHLVANVSTQLCYFNETENDLECAFVLPLNESAAIYHFEAQLNNRVIVAEIQDREEARNTYERAVDQNQTSFLLEQDSRCADTFKISLGNLPAKSEARLTLKYIQELEMLTLSEAEKSSNMAAFSFTLPCVLNPRYDPDALVESFQNDVLLNLNPYTFHFVAFIHGSMPIHHIEGGKDKFQLEYLNPSRSSAKAVLEEASTLSRKHDLTLHIYYEDMFQPHLVYERGDLDSSISTSQDNPLLKSVDVVMLNFLPNLKSISSKIEPSRQEFIFLIDQSGSMADYRITKAKETLLLLLKSLPIDCYFQIIGFGSSFQSLFPSPQKYDEGNLNFAIQYQESIDAELGGTEILAPLNHIYCQPIRKGFSRCIFLLTDGDVANAQEVEKLVGKHAPNTTVFTVGIGEGASSALIKGVARASGGLAEFIRDDDDKFSGKILSLLKAAMEPRIDNVKVTVSAPKGVASVCIPESHSSIFNHQLFTQFVLLKGDLKEISTRGAKVTVSGNLNGDIWSLQFDMNRPNNGVDSESTTASRCLHRALGKKQIQSMENEEDIKKVSKAFNIVSQYTSFVGVDTESKKELSRFPYLPKMGSDDVDFCLCMDKADIVDGIFDSNPYHVTPAPRKMKRSSLFKCSPLACFGIQSKSSSKKSKPMDKSWLTYNMMSLRSPMRTEYTSVILTLASLQQFNGLWRCNQAKVWEALNLSVDSILALKPSDWTEDEFVTLIVITFLEIHHPDKESEWNLFVDKAKTCLTSTHSAKVLQILVEEWRHKLTSQK